jgi:hypothetical protein
MRDDAGAAGVPVFVRENARPLSEPDLLVIGIVLIVVMAILFARRVTGGGRR